MNVIKKFNFFNNTFCRMCGHLKWLDATWQMTDAPSDVRNPHICMQCCPSYKYSIVIFQKMIDNHDEQKHTPSYLKPVFKPYLVRKR